MIPITALFEPNTESEGAYVWVVDSVNNIVTSRQIILGRFQSDSRIEVLEGLSDGEVIVTAGVSRLVDGQKVKLLAEAN